MLSKILLVLLGIFGLALFIVVCALAYFAIIIITETRSIKEEENK